MTINESTFIIMIAILIVLLWTIILLLLLFCIEQTIIRQLVKQETKKMWDDLRRTVYLSMVAQNQETVVWNPNEDLDVTSR